MEILPREILLDILSRLPTSSLHIVKRTCHSWRRLIQDPTFVNMHINRMSGKDPCLILHSDFPVQNQLFALYFYPHSETAGLVKKISVPVMPEFQIVGSCNGLLCLCDALHKSTFYIYNPFTGDCVEQPKSIQNSDVWTVFGFGFHPTTKEYKVLKIVHGAPGGFPHRVRLPSRSKVEVLTLGSPNWRRLGEISYHLTESKPQVLVNGRLHWVNWPLRYRPGRMLVSFDLVDEQFREVPKPDSPDLERRGYSLVVLRGRLSATFYSNFAQFDIWVMKDYGVKESWIREICIGTHVPRGLEQSMDRSFKASKFYLHRSFTRVLCGLKNGEILLEYKCRALASYDPKSRTFSDITIEGMPDWFEAVSHAGNLNNMDALIDT